MARSVAAFFLTVALALALALASLTAAVARGQAPGSTAITICTGSGPETIPLGPDGEPAAPRLACPDCTAALGPAPAPTSPGLPLASETRRAQTPARMAPCIPVIATGLAGARAPPLPV